MANKKWLALDTSTASLSLALGQGPDLISQGTGSGQVQHGQSLVPEIQRLLDQAQWQAQDIDRLIVGQGPGSYTGLRIGVTLAKVWAQAQAIPMAAVSSLALLSGQGLGTGDRYILPVLDSRRQTAYTGLYYQSQGRLLGLLPDGQRQWEPFVQSLKDLLASRPPAPLVLLGPDPLTYFLETAQAGLPGQLVEPIQASPQAGLVASPALRDWVQDQEDVAGFGPNYCLASLAEREWAQSQGRDLGDDSHEGYIDLHT